jgi:hypothetical protein
MYFMTYKSSFSTPIEVYYEDYFRLYFSYAVQVFNLPTSRLRDCTIRCKGSSASRGVVPQGAIWTYRSPAIRPKKCPPL